MQSRKKAQVVFFVLVASLLPAGRSLPATDADTRPDTVRASGALRHSENMAFTAPRHDLNLAFTVPGMVATVSVKPGDHVKKGQILIELEDKEGQAQIDILELQNKSNVAVDSAEAALRMSRWELGKVQGLLERDAVSHLEVERAQIQEKISYLQLEQAKLEKAQLVHQLARARATHARYTLTAPLDGIVEQVVVSAGETVEQLKPVLRLVVIDPLWIDAQMPIEATLKLRVGAPVWLQLELPDYVDTPVAGRIIHLGQVADNASGRRLVRVEMPNGDSLPAGVELKVSFEQPVPLARAAEEGN